MKKSNSCAWTVERRRKRKGNMVDREKKKGKKKEKKKEKNRSRRVDFYPVAPNSRK